MLTPEQIKNLKPGDNLLLEAFFVEKDGDNIKFTLEPTYVPGTKVFSASPYSLRFLCGADRTFCHVGDNIVNPKYSPCRLFKKGDIVKRRTVDGRTDPDVSEAINLTVTTDEDKYGNVREQEPNGRWIVTKSVFLELVTPVEELEAYSVKETMSHDGWQIVRDGLPLAIYDSQRHPNAKAAAEDECDRLNAEWRKENQK